MKCAEYYLDNNKIEIFATLFGKELIMVNDKQVSELKSSTKRPHRFQLGANTYYVSSKLDFAKPSGKIFEVYKNGNELSLVNFKPQSPKALLHLIVILAISFALFIGFYLYNAYFIYLL